MQLKRDTDVAIRILYCLNQNRESQSAGETNGLTLAALAAQTGVPKTVVGRICEYLYRDGMIRLSPEMENGEKTYFAGEELLSVSLLKVVTAVEGTVQLFAVFDQTSAAYKRGQTQIKTVQEKVERVLSETRMGQLLEGKKESELVGN